MIPDTSPTKYDPGAFAASTRPTACHPREKTRAVSTAGTRIGSRYHELGGVDAAATPHADVGHGSIPAADATAARPASNTEGPNAGGEVKEDGDFSKEGTFVVDGGEEEDAVGVGDRTAADVDVVDAASSSETTSDTRLGGGEFESERRPSASSDEDIG